MTKKACDYLGRSLSNEYKNTNIGVHRIYPGLTITEFITNNKKLPPIMARMCNTIGDLPENVARNLCPQILNIEGTNKNIEHETQLNYKFLFLKSMIFGPRNKFFDNDGNFIYKR
jgi:short-subunit dehydrogenase